MEKQSFSPFLSAVLGFLILLAQGGKPIEIKKSDELPVFRSIIEHPTEEEAPDTPQVAIFTAFTCENCRAFGLGNVKLLKENEEYDGDIDLNLYLTPNEEDEMDVRATKAALCSGEQDLYWEMAIKLYELEAITPDAITAKAAELELDEEEFNECMESEEILEGLKTAEMEKERQKIEVLPSTVINHKLFIGAHPLENLEWEIRKHL